MLVRREQMTGPHPLSRMLCPANFLAQVFLVSRIAWLLRYYLRSRRIPWFCYVWCGACVFVW